MMTAAEIEEIRAEYAHGWRDYADVSEIEDDARRRGSHWFDLDTRRFFRSRVLSRVFPGGVFVSSERGPDDVRRYSVRRIRPRGERTRVIETVGAFGAYRTAADAYRAAAEFSRAVVGIGGGAA